MLRSLVRSLMVKVRIRGYKALGLNALRYASYILNLLNILNGAPLPQAGGALGERWGMERSLSFFGKSQESRAKVKYRYRKRGDYCRGFCGRWLELNQILQEASVVVASETSACALVATVRSEQRD